MIADKRIDAFIDDGALSIADDHLQLFVSGQKVIKFVPQSRGTWIQRGLSHQMLNHFLLFLQPVGLARHQVIGNHQIHHQRDQRKAQQNLDGKPM